MTLFAGAATASAVTVVVGFASLGGCAGGSGSGNTADAAYPQEAGSSPIWDGSPSDGPWYCVPGLGALACDCFVKPVTADFCKKPKPSCCFVRQPGDRCSCWVYDASDAKCVAASPGDFPVATCPPS